jgi:hypothetical protein
MPPPVDRHCVLRLLRGGDAELWIPEATALAARAAASAGGPLAFRDLDVLDEHLGTMRVPP